MRYDNSLPGRPQADLLEALEEDLTIIRRELLHVLQETAHVRASMTEVSSWRPAVTKRFVVVCGVVCFMVASALILYQGHLREWAGRIDMQIFRSRS